MQSSLPILESNVVRHTPKATQQWDKPSVNALIEQQRQRLPAYKVAAMLSPPDGVICVVQMRQQVVDVVNNNRVVVISGETGCGKTTQVPQYVLEAAPNSANIICTQPRRIAAIGVAERVADEVGERIGQTVGYQVL